MTIDKITDEQTHCYMIMCVLTSIFYIFNDEGSTDGNITIAISVDLIELKAIKYRRKEKKRRKDTHTKRERAKLEKH